MKNLKEYIVEGIFDIDNNIDNIDESVRDRIKQFLKDNFIEASSYKISNKPNKDGKYEVLCEKSVFVKNKKITSFTNDMFVWTDIKGDFDCRLCNSLTSLKGAPEKVSGNFICNFCDSLISLEGAPKEVGGSFYSNFCNSLKSLKGAPKEVNRNFQCNDCKSLTSLEGAPKKVGASFSCSWCVSLKSLKGAPKEVGRDFYCHNCSIAFTIDDVKKVSNAKGMIRV